MDPNPKAFPILSYVMSRLQLGPGPGPNSPRSIDAEQPPVPARPGDQVELVERMPHLRHPELIASMSQAISDVAKTRSVLRNLGERPDHEAVDNARARIAEIGAKLAAEIESLGDAAGDGAAQREAECRARAERERAAYRAVVQLDEMHGEYEKMLREAEERLVRIYRSAESGASKPEGSGKGEGSERERVDEEVVRILQEASGKGAKSVELRGRELRFLPEAFGRLRGLLVLNLGNNKLELEEQRAREGGGGGGDAMDPNPKTFPVLSYVLSRLHLGPRPGSGGPLAVDVEQSLKPLRPDHVELVERMPGLVRPDLIAAMAQAVSDVAQTRSILRTLGERPDHEAVDAARARIVEIDAVLAAEIESLGDAGDGVVQTEAECRARAERERIAYRAVVQLDEMHGAYEELLREAEERLLKIYRSAESETPTNVESGGALEKEGREGGKVDEEVIKILQEASGKSVERVDLSGRDLRYLPEAFGRIRGLLVLNLSKNQLEAIPDSIAGLEHLEELYLSSNLLLSLPDSIGLLLNLKILDVSGNKLKALPDSISHCRSLVELDASYNELMYLPTNIGYELINLQKLSVHLNKLRSLPTSICEMNSLRHLDAHFNELRGLPHAIGNLTNLETLDLSSNFSDMTVLPDTFGDLTNLKELNLSNNQIHALPDTFGRLDNLVKLNLDQNPLVIPPVDVINEGAEAVKDYMSRRWLNILLEEEQKSTPEASTQPQGWLTRSTSWLNTWVSGVSGSVTGYLGTGDKTPRDPYLDQQLSWSLSIAELQASIVGVMGTRDHQAPATGR
ncbi:hypothetical protein Taro_025157 [Colocasia esculenta]|uniref:Uncharacterized protein n=1 Tax=Colocasia esculenta TaxID=4460 RepID=A0A843V850_COLES|nr:hypothetical protein [Colocasia esculenta]